MCSRFSTRRPRLCTIWTAVAPEAVFTRRTKAPTPRDYPRRQAPLVTTSAPIHGQTPTSAAPEHVAIFVELGWRSPTWVLPGGRSRVTGQGNPREGDRHEDRTD